MLRHLKDFRSGVYFEDINDEFLAKFELALIAKGLSNNYTHKSMMDIKTFLNWATKKGYNKKIMPIKHTSSVSVTKLKRTAR